MTLARATGSIERTWRQVSGELESLYGPAQRDGMQRRWTLSLPSMRLNITADPSTGRLDMAVMSTVPYAPAAVGTGTLAFASLFVVQDVWVRFASLVLCTLVGFWGLLPGIVMHWVFHDRTSELVSISEFKVTPFALIPFSGLFFVAFATAGSGTHQALISLFALLFGGAYAMMSKLGPASLRRQSMLILLPLLTALPLFLSVGNVVLLAQIASIVSPSSLLSFALVFLLNTLLVVGTYSYLCDWFVRGAHTVPNRPIGLQPLRIAWGAYYLGVNIGIFVLGTGFATGWWGPMRLGNLRHELVAGFKTMEIPGPTVLTDAYLLILVSPVLLVWVLWCWHLLRTLRARRSLLQTADSSAPIHTEVPIRVVESPHVFAHPVRSLAGNKSVVVSSTVVNALNDDELRAVVAHEQYHLQHGDVFRNLVAGLFGLLVGGKNALVAVYDYPRIEREADRYAAEQVETAAVIRALRRLEQIQTETARSEPISSEIPAGGTFIVHSLVTGPYQVLFGEVVLKNAHATTDERVRYLLGE